MNVRRSLLLGVLLAVLVVLLIMIWVVLDGTFIVRGDMVNVDGELIWLLFSMRLVS